MHLTRRAARVTFNAAINAVFSAAIALVVTASALAAQLPQSEYADHRAALATAIKDGIIFGAGGRNPVTDFGPFYQIQGFQYLTNYKEPDAAFVMLVQGGRATSWLFTTASDPRRAFYYGRRPDSAALHRAIGLPARPIATLVGVLDSLVALQLPLYHVADFEDADFQNADSLTRGRTIVRALVARHPGLEVRDAHPFVDRIRAKKSPAELALIKKAAQISTEGHRAAMSAPEARFEYELQAAVEGAFLKGGAARTSYGSIVGAGMNGTQLHYMKNRAAIARGDLVVIDAGAEYEGYAADVTRTIPANGKFSPEQRQLYQIVRDAQAAAERNSKLGQSSVAQLDSSERVRLKGLAKLGLIEAEEATFDPPWNVDCAKQPRQCQQGMLWMIHGISHGIGLAVHDPAQFYEGDRTFKAGDAFTIEPGLYISTRSLDALPDTPKNRAFMAKVKAAVARYEGAGVRIEDSYIMTEQGLERVSLAPREIAEIEALMAKRPRVQP